jgi:transposase
VRLLFLDEARVGLKGQTGRRLTLRGVKPLSPRQHEFKNTHLVSALDPLSGWHLEAEISHCDLASFGWFLRQLSDALPGETLVLVLDRAGWHTSGALAVPAAVRLCHLPPYSPELNPVERLWQEMRRVLKDRFFPGLADVVQEACAFLMRCSATFIQSLCAYPYIRELSDALSDD